MASLHFALGAEADVASGAEVDAARDAIMGGIGGLGDRLDHRPGRYLPRKVVKTAKAGGTTKDVLCVGGPSRGRVWDLAYLTITGADDKTALAGVTCALYVGTDPDSLSLADLVDPAIATTAPPFSVDYSKDQLLIQGGEQLIVVAYGATLNQQLTVIARSRELEVAELFSSRI